VIQAAAYRGCETYVFTRSEEHQELARTLGAVWAGKPDERAPTKLHCAIDFTPVGETVPIALSSLEKGGRLVMAVIRKRTMIPAMDYAGLLWHEREIKSVANVTRADVDEFLSLAAQIPIVPDVHDFPFEQANSVLRRLKEGKIRGAAVLRFS
jgi:alcohol dehydrogenase, propanol-preferring